MITISQLAACAGCTVKAVRTYHQRGLLPEPPRDASGYRRYDAQAVIDLTRIITLVRSGIPLADVPTVLAADEAEHLAVIERIGADLDRRIADLQHRREQLDALRSPDRLCLSDDVVAHLEHMRALGFSERLIAVERDAWILTSAVVPDVAREYLPLQAQLLHNADYIDLLRRYDEALDWPPTDARMDDLVEATCALALRVAAPQGTASSHLPRELLNTLATYDGGSPTWAALSVRVERRMRALTARVGAPS